jgi:hypothetical protein
MSSEHCQIYLSNYLLTELPIGHLVLGLFDN